MSAVHYRPLRVVIVRRLSTQLTAEELRHLAGRAVQRRRDVDHVGDRRLDAVAAAFDLADDARHLVAVFRVVDGLGAGDVDDLRHGVLFLSVYRVIGTSYCCWAALCTLALALRFSRSGMHTKWCRMDRLMCVMAPACVLLRVGSGLRVDAVERYGRGRGTGRGYSHTLEKNHRTLIKASGGVYHRQEAIFGRLGLK